MSEFSNGLTQAQEERLAILMEECGEAIQAAAKVLRHGYESCNPLTDTMDTRTATDNRKDLQKECGDIYEAILMLCRANDIDDVEVNRRQAEKHEKIKRWLHHQ